MKKILGILAVAALMFISCGEEQKTKQIDPDKKAVARIEIEGMMCAQGCGGKITKELNELDCVAGTTIEFDENNPVDVAVVEFEKGACDEKSFTDKIAAIGDGAYKVIKVTIE